MELDGDACYRALTTRDARFDGRFFTGVVTTGIYCRPVCPARTPKRANVRFFPSAAAAQDAGFRPCLRCRPETAPEVAAWRGTSNTVSRALALIEQGAAEESDLPAIADRLGIGERQLRRLFHQHVGASPIAVVQTRRVLLAKQLIHETTLSMADVAMGSGFGSIRRFNETFRAMFGCAPGDLRRRDGADAGRGGDVTVLLRYRPPYDWDGILEFLRVRAMPGVEVVTGGTYRRTIDIDGAHGTIAVSATNQDALRVTIRIPRMSALPAIIARVRRVFDLAADPLAISAQLAEDAALAPLVRARPGLRVPGAWDGYELGVRAILGQQVTVRAAVALAGTLVARCGERLAAPADGLTHVFPRPDRLSARMVGTLPMPRARSSALASLASAVAADPHLFGPRQSLDAAVARLRALPGIGEWTAQYIAMRALREPDAFPAADIGLLRAMADAAGRRPTPRELLQRAERWRPWRAYAALHLWGASGSTGSAGSSGSNGSAGRGTRSTAEPPFSVHPFRSIGTRVRR